MIKLLHVEDDADIREIAKMSLELSGDFVVEQCDCGEQALEKTLDYIPDVFLLDMMMPGMTGRQTLEKLRENPAKTRRGYSPASFQAPVRRNRIAPPRNHPTVRVTFWRFREYRRRLLREAI
jgi:CheY-like chemotaxis protein